MIHPLLRTLIDLDLPQDDHALFGSGPLLARGWIDNAGDLDVLARGAAWERALSLGEIRRLDGYGVDVVAIGDHITVGTTWGIGEFDVDELIDGAETIQGVPCVRLEHVVAYKRIARRPKDRRHLAVIAEHLAAGER